MNSLTSEDIKILDLLQNNADRSSSEIANILNINQSPCWRRINRLEKQSLIKEKIAVLNRELLGYKQVVFVNITLNATEPQQLSQFEYEVSLCDKVLECYSIAGPYDYMLKVIAKDANDYEKTNRNVLLSLPFVSNIKSLFSLNEIKNTRKIPLSNTLHKL